jgi:peroxiredoxin
VTFDDGLTWFTAATTGGNFSVDQENLDDGNYRVRARAIDVGGNIGQSSTQTLLVDNLPPIVGGSAFSFGPQILSSDSNGLVRVSADAQITTALSMRGGVIKAEVTSDNKTFPLTPLPGTNIWTGNVSFNNPGVKDLVVSAEDGVGKKTERSVGKVIVEPVGKVTNENETQPIQGATASAFFFDRNSQTWVLWDAVSYGQTNPKKVSSDGSYSFIVPPGRYYVQIDAPGRRRAQSNIFDFTETSILNANFKTTPSINIFSNLLPPDISTAQNKLIENTSSQNILGNSIPSFNLPSSNTSEIVSSNSFIGKKTVFSFISTWAPESVAQAEILQKLKPQISSGQRELAIALQETPSSAETFLKRGGYDFPLVADVDGFTGENYRVGALPFHVFIDTKGKIRETYSGILHESELLNKLNKLQ